jgi:asparagine synthase (glutamine-hydrolysing)
MCGIAGAVNWADGERIARMTSIQAHRGPDDSGVWERHLPDGTHMALGSRRLAIIDLSPAGHMPMRNADGTVWITFNGEIYNFRELRADLVRRGHRFESGTDTEVLLRLYEVEGPECVKRLNGMFAFAISDLRQSRPVMFMARDHFGIKPLYYVHAGRQLAFASEIKALLQLPGVHAQVDLEALHQYLTFLWVPDPLTLFDGIRKLPAGHYAVFRDGQLDIVQYWDLTFPRADAAYRYSEAELASEVSERFRRSVRSQMISDVPIGAFLSAGLDSTSIVGVMSEQTREPVRTYTITFPPKYRIGETTLDDPGVAARVAQRFGCDHHEIVVEPGVADLLPRLIWHMDEPIADPAIIMAYLVCQEARKTSTVLLSGIGGDELFAGYRKHYAHRWIQAYRWLPAFARRYLQEASETRLPMLRGTPLKGAVRLTKKMLRSGMLPPQDAFLMQSTYLDEAHKNMLYSPALRAEINGGDPWRQHRAYFDQVEHASFLHQMLYVDTKAFMVSLNLTYNDKMSMASSVEVRVPFLDHELAEFVAHNVPPQLKLNGFWRPTTKYIFRKAMQDVLPSEVLRQPKAGFGAPVDYWLTYDLREMVDDLLSERRIRERGYFDPKTVRRLIQAHRSGRQDWSMQLWQLITLEVWLQTFVDRSQPAQEHRTLPTPVS